MHWAGKTFLSGILKIAMLLDVENLFVEKLLHTPDTTFEKIINIAIAKVMMKYKK